jgi:pyridoxamine 5'-phosphate oxidase
MPASIRTDSSVKSSYGMEAQTRTEVMDRPDELAALRQRHRVEGIDASDLDPDPFVQFDRWFAVVRDRTAPDPEAVVLATVDPDGRPSVRNVLLRGLDPEGFVFFTNYESRKARAIAHESNVALLFSWVAVGRQVIVEGRADRLTVAESDAYWATRPRGSQLGALASPQSQVVSSRAELDALYAAAAAAHEGRDIPRPVRWGGFRVRPDTFELWQGREDRLHDRLRYRRSASSPSGWSIERLAP